MRSIMRFDWMEPQSSIFLLLLEFEANLKGIVIVDHRQPSEAFSWPRCIHRFRSHRSGTRSSPAPICYNVNGRIKRDILLRSMMQCIG